MHSLALEFFFTAVKIDTIYLLFLFLHFHWIYLLKQGLGGGTYICAVIGCRHEHAVQEPLYYVCFCSSVLSDATPAAQVVGIDNSEI